MLARMLSNASLRISEAFSACFPALCLARPSLQSQPEHPFLRWFSHTDKAKHNKDEVKKQCKKRDLEKAMPAPLSAFRNEANIQERGTKNDFEHAINSDPEKPHGPREERFFEMKRSSLEKTIEKASTRVRK